MKKLFSIICCLVYVFGFIGCHRNPERISPFGWERIEPRFDSLTEVLEWDFLDGVGHDTIRRDIDLLKAIAASNRDNPTMQVRSMYWDARLMMRTDRYDESLDLFERAERMAMEDSARYPYDLARIRWNTEPYFDPLTIDSYNKILADIDFFEGQQDYPIAAAKCMDIGMLLSELGDIDESFSWLDRADSLFSIAGLEEPIMKNRINRARNLEKTGQRDEAEKMLRAIIADPRIDRDPTARDVVLYNLYVQFGDTAALRRAYSWISTADNRPDVQCLYEANIAMELAEAGKLDSARIYMEKAASKLNSVSDLTFRRTYYLCRATVMKTLGETDSACLNLEHYIAVSDSLYDERRSEQILTAEVLRQLGELKLRAESERHSATIIYMFVIIILLILGGAGSFLIYRQWRSRRETVMQADLEIERSRRKVMAMQLAMEESSRIIDSMSAEVEKLSADGDVTASAAQRLERTIRAHESVRGEQNNFIATFGEADPEFLPRLRARWPGLTDTDAKLCIYISLGLDIKHIARQMGIQPESVKQARWRLRKKLDPTGNRTIEEILRSV